MKKTLRLFILTLLVGSVPLVSSYAETIDTPSVIKQVTIYPDSAVIKRSINLQLQPGAHSVVLKSLVPMLDESSLTVSGSGTAQVRIFGAQLKQEYLKAAADERVKNLEQKIETLDDQVLAEKNNLAVLEEEKAFLNSIKLFSGQQIPKDLVTTMPSVDHLRGTIDFVVSRLAAVEANKQKTNIRIRDVLREKDVLVRELNRIRNSGQEMQRSIVVDLECLQAGKLNLEISYLVYGVNWRPVYDARVAFDKNSVDLSAFAFIQQNTGEDWNEVALTVSTAKPLVGGQMPELFSWILSPYEVYRQKGGMGGGRTLQAKLMNADMAMESAAPMADERRQNYQAETIFAELQNAGVNMVYKIARPVSIKSDGTEQRVGISTQTLPVVFEYAATPKLSPYAYLKSEVINNQEGQLLPGQVKIFLDENYVGSSNIAKTIGPQEKFDLYLGIDESVTVKRELLEQKSDDTLIAGIPSPNKTIFYKYKLTVESYKAKPVKVNLFDQIPVSQDDKIRIKNVQFSIKPSEQDYRDRKGVVRWAFDLKPKEKKEIEFSFVVEHPRDLPVGGL